MYELIFLLYVHMWGWAAMLGCVVVSGCTAGPICSGLPLSRCSAFRRASGGHGGHMIGPRQAELDAPIVLQQTHPFGVRLSLHCQATPQHGSVSSRMFCVGFISFQSRWRQNWCTCCRKGKMDISAHLPQQSSAGTSVYHPPAHAMFGSHLHDHAVIYWCRDEPCMY